MHEQKLISVLLALTLLLSVAALPAGAITEDEIANAAELTLGEEATENIETGGQYAYFKFTPTVTCKYAFYSSGNSDTFGYLYDSVGNQLASDDDSGEGSNFRIEAQLTAEQTYYFSANYLSDGRIGPFSVKLELIHSWGAYNTTNPPTCTADGLETSICSICSETATRPIPALGHTISDHVSNDNGTHTGHCSVCNQDVTEPCTYTDTMENGIVKHTCTKCGYSYTEEVVGEQSLAFWGFEDGSNGWIFIDLDDKNWSRSSGNAYEGSYKIYFNKDINNLANADLSEEEKSMPDVPADMINKPYNSELTVLPDGVTFESVTLSLKSDTTLSLYFKSSSSLNFSCMDTTSEEEKTVEKQIVGEYQVARIRGIKARELFDDFVLTVSDGTANGSVTYSPATYGYNVIVRGTEDLNLKRVVMAMCYYYYAAQIYANGGFE